MVTVVASGEGRKGTGSGRELCYVIYLKIGNMQIVHLGGISIWVYCYITHTFKLKRCNICIEEMLKGNTLEY